MRPALTTAILSLFALSACAQTAALAYDWSSPTPVTTDEGWMIGPCPGDGAGAMACVTVSGAWKGVIEHGSAPLDTLTDVPAGASNDEALDIVTADFVESFRQDRSAGCADWEFVPAKIETVTVAGSDGRVVGFALRRDGVVTEVSETRFAVIDDEIHWLTTNALDPVTACLVDPEVAAPTVGEWETLRPGFAAVAAGSSF